MLQIKILRQLGLSVPDIRAFLTTSSPRQIVAMHLTRTRERIERLQRGCRRLDTVEQALEQLKARLP